MPRPDFQAFEAALLKAGIPACRVRRTALELGEHFDDLVAEGLHAGQQPDEAEDAAAAALGDLQALVAAMRARPELRGWAYRYPRTAVVLYPLAYLALLPVLPISAGVSHATVLGRWALSAVLSALFTATILLLLELSIVLT